MSTIAFSGTTSERKAKSSTKNARTRTKPITYGQAVVDLAGEVDVLRDGAGDGGLGAGDASDRLRDELLAEHETARRLCVLSPVPRSGR